jgi:hypothetical protein
MKSENSPRYYHRIFRILINRINRKSAREVAGRLTVTIRILPVTDFPVKFVIQSVRPDERQILPTGLIMAMNKSTQIKTILSVYKLINYVKFLFVPNFSDADGPVYINTVRIYGFWMCRIKE